MDTLAISTLIDRLGGTKLLGASIRTTNDLRHRIQIGLPVRSLDAVLTQLPTLAQRNEIKYKIVPRSTLARRGSTLTPDESERLERVARVISLAEAVWQGEEDQAWKFLNKPNAVLGGEAPIDVALQEIGARQVEDILNRIVYGIPA